MINNQVDKQRLVEDAMRALLYEVSIHPKPGLVDPVTNGSHLDMDMFTFIDSSISLMTYFQECVEVGWTFDKPSLIELFQQIRPIGIKAEKSMFAATKGINTHKGAVFSLGILVTATAYVQNHEETDPFTVVKKMLKGLTKHDFDGIDSKPESELTAGEREYLKYGITGIRGEAEAGYPTVTDIALPRLAMSKGNKNVRLLDTLMAIVGQTTDTNLVKRAGTTDIIPWAHEQVTHYFELGGANTVEGMAFLESLDDEFAKQNLSLGGSADLLIVTIFAGLVQGLI
ncbi:triphosphoribosyl-dephospho-CoA synthase CitG [Lentilactobacillus sp. SPB1-3]|uniref:Triphosphoribosyl-dephospho-CoA synthase CitG n=1 Tax=Lentilactobacillus terminaliae TaxID=3003483 RepID=A0ACD5DFK5_9LACO|nr:triphosphoribosyl-dephospho-CoA synthase CitG [Lentilactobacillus sp. SPB1-3]MCZ0976691.1 triphosphoribosyl-dephospho-CoA synthase CitG [Lentilactobacillus sp. SPB1-3]